MTAGPRVSVLIPTFNRAQYLPLAIESVLGQTRLPDEVLVVDDGSTDGTAEAVARFGSRVGYLAQANAGKSAALNLAMPRTSGDFIWIMDDDDLALPDALDRHLAGFEADPSVGFTYGGVITFADGADLEGTRNPPLPMPDVPPDALFCTLLERFYIWQPSMLVRRRCYDEVGPFRVDLLRSQDYEMLLRIARRFPGMRLPGATFLQRQHDGRPTAARPAGHVQRMRVWRKFGLTIFGELYRSLELRDYLPGAPAGELGEAERFTAYLQRASILARKGMADLACSDLTAAHRAAQAAAIADLTPWQLGICRRMMADSMSVEIALDGDAEQMAGLRRFLSCLAIFGQRGIGRQIRVAAVSPLYYMAKNAAAGRDRHRLQRIWTLYRSAVSVPLALYSFGGKLGRRVPWRGRVAIKDAA